MAETTKPLKLTGKFIREWIVNLFTDKSLTKKAYLNAIASGLDYFARLLVGFFITPILVGGLGDFYYGAWQVIMRLEGYLTPASGRAVQALKMTLANQQNVAEADQKREYVGSTFYVWLIFLPLTAILGGVVTWYLPIWLKAAPGAYLILRIASMIMVLNVVATSLSNLPRSVMEGENLGYKRMGLSTLLVFLGGGFTWIALAVRTGLVGVAVSYLLITIVTGLFFLIIVKSYAPWFGFKKPTVQGTRQFFGLSIWFTLWNLIMSLMTASDVVVLGFFQSAQSVTGYTLSKYAPETTISIISIIVFGILPGLGGIIGSGELQRARTVRSEIMSFTWWICIALGTTILLWNRSFISLWVGPDHYAGMIECFLILLMVTQFVLLRNDANIIDLTLNLPKKVVLGLISVSVSLTGAILALSVFDGGIIGLCLGIMLGRLILSLSYPIIVGKHLELSFSGQLKSFIRPCSVLVIFFALASYASEHLPAKIASFTGSWIGLIVSVAISALLIFIFSFFASLEKTKRGQIIRRLKMILSMRSSS